MPVAWFICKITRRANSGPYAFRRPVVFDYIQDIGTDGGKVALTEVLGGFAVAKVKASDATLDKIAADANVQRLPKSLLTASLSDLTNAQKTAIVNKLEEMGYTTTEIKDKLGSNIGSKILADVLKFAATRYHKPRWDRDADIIYLDGEQRTPTSIEDVDGEVQ